MVYRKTDLVESRLADNRQRIVDAALDLVGEGGWQAVSIAMVAEIAKVSVGSVYRYFPSKADLLVEAYRSQSTRETDVVLAIAATDMPADEKLSAVIKGFASRAMKARRTAYAMLGEPTVPEVGEVRLEYNARFAAMFAGILKQGADEGLFIREDTSMLANCIVGALRETLVGPLSTGVTRAPGASEALISRLVAFCLRAVVRPER